MQVWIVLCAARWKYSTQKSPKSRHLGIIPQLCRAISSQLRHVSTFGKKLLSSNISSICPRNMVNIGPLAAETCWRVWGTPTNFNGFRILAALLHGIPVSAKLNDVEQRAPPIFGRAAITLGIGPHSSSFYHLLFLFFLVPWGSFWPHVNRVYRIVSYLCCFFGAITNAKILSDAQLEHDVRVLASRCSRFVGSRHGRRPPWWRWDWPALLAEIQRCFLRLSGQQQGTARRR